MKDIVEGIPIWTDQGNVGGLDPLAMLAPIEQLYQGLLSGVSSVTVRVRYYSFFAWWLHEYGQTVRSDSRTDLEVHVRKGEALIGLLSRAQGYGGGLAGENTFGAFLQNEGPDYDLKKLRVVYLNTPAFLAVYGPQMAEMGILRRTNAHKLMVPTEEIGIPLATAFEEVIGHEAAALFRDVAQQDSVDRETLEKMGSMVINFPDPMAQTEEMNLLRNLLVGKIGKGERRNTLIEILHVALSTGALPQEWLIRFNWLEHLPKEGDLRFAERMKWAHFQVADSMRVGMEALLRHSVLALTDHGPLPPHDLAAEVCSRVPTGVSFCDYLIDLANSSETLSIRELQERTVKDGEDLESKMALLAKLWVDWAPRIADIDSTFPPRGHFRTSASELRFLVSLEEKDARLAMAEFVRHRLLLRHLFVAARKLRFQGNNTFQFEYEEGNLIARKSGLVGAAGPRIATIISFMTQLGLLDKSGLTDLGIAELQTQ